MADDFSVATTAGLVRGRPSDPGTVVWKGIPYARTRRFLPPVPVEPWTEPRDCARSGAVAMQSRDPRVALMSGISDKMAMSEDCLHLNIAAPADYARGPGRAVVVWIHGGAFVMGAGSTPLYRAEAFAASGVICVSINYRLGALGLLYLGHLDPAYAAGNVALLDQIAALRWVRDNIAAFGGDPAQVTVMGESAGGVSIAALLAMPAARGLFARAILQSGGSRLVMPTREDAIAVTAAVMAKLGATTAEAVIDAPVDDLLRAQFSVSAKLGLAAFMPYVDGVSIPRDAVTAYRDGTAISVPMLAGTNRDEFTLFAVFLGDAAIAPLRAALGAWFGEAGMAMLLAAYEAQTDGVARGIVDLIGDVSFRIPTAVLAESNRAPTWVYRFDWRTPAAGGLLGAAHALELPFVWRQLDAAAAAFLIGGAHATAAPLGDRIHATWVQFIQTGACDWPRYDAATRTTKLFDTEDRIVDDPNGATRAAWYRLLGDGAPLA